MDQFLQQRFLQRNDKDDLRLENLKKLIKTTSPTGKSMLEYAEKNKIDISFDFLDSCNGLYMPSAGAVLLNRTASNHVLATTLVHEIQHSKQVLEQDSQNTIFSNIAIERACEADAMATQSAVAYEMATYYQRQISAKKNFDSKISTAAIYAGVTFSASHPQVYQAYKKSIRKDQDSATARKEAFKAWYSDKEYMNMYDKQVIDNASLNMLSKKAFTKNPSPVDLYPDFNYVEPSFFKSKEATTLPENLVKQASSIERYNIKNIFKLFNKNIPTSADNFYTEKADGTIVPPKNQKAVQTALLNKQVQR